MIKVPGFKYLNLWLKLIVVLVIANLLLNVFDGLRFCVIFR
jgi:hypothetical protein